MCFRIENNHSDNSEIASCNSSSASASLRSFFFDFFLITLSFCLLQILSSFRYLFSSCSPLSAFVPHRAFHQCSNFEHSLWLIRGFGSHECCYTFLAYSSLVLSRCSLAAHPVNASWADTLPLTATVSASKVNVIFLIVYLNRLCLLEFG